MPRLPKEPPVNPITDLAKYREDVKKAEYQGGHRHALKQPYHDAYADDAHSAVMGMIDRLAGTLAAHADNFDGLFSAVDWGDRDDYGEDVLAPSAAKRAEAVLFLKRLARTSATKLCVALPVPDISPTVDGNIDIHWGPGETRELLLCVRGNGVASFFGKAPNGKTIKGSADTDSDNMYLAAWLTEK